MVVFDKLNIDVENYFYCENNETSYKISELNHGKNIIRLEEDILNITENQIQSICPIDILLGGLPCCNFSKANPGRTGLTGNTLLVEQLVTII